MAYDEKFREKAVEYKDNGHTFEELKEAFGIVSSTYYRWRENKERTGFYVEPKTGPVTRKRKIDPEKLKKVIEEKPDLFLKELAEIFDCSITSVHNRLKKLKITVKKKTFTYSEKSESDRAEYLEKLEKIPETERVYVDECGVHKHLVREKGRAVRGVKVQDTKRGKKFRKTNVVAARQKDASGNVRHIAPLCYEHNMNSAFFAEWFRTKLVKSIRKGSTIIMDRASFHPKIKLRNIARRHGMKLLFLPSYSPDFNPIEKDWANMKKALIDIVKDTATLEQGIYCYFNIADN
jgi:transposase